MSKMQIAVLRIKFIVLFIKIFGTLSFSICDHFSLNRPKIFGAMSKDSYSEICEHFSIDFVENVVANRRNCFH